MKKSEHSVNGVRVFFSFFPCAGALMYCPYCGIKAELVKYPRLDYPACDKCMIKQLVVNYTIYEKIVSEHDPNFERTEEFVRDALEKITGYPENPSEKPSKRGRKPKTCSNTPDKE